MLDVLVALTERGDEAEQMAQWSSCWRMGVEAPLVIDTTEADVIEAALEHVSRPRDRQLDQPGERARAHRRRAAAGGRARRGGRRADDRRSQGMAKTAERKLEVAQAHLRHRRRRVRPGAGSADLRRADLPARDRRGGVTDAARARRSKASAASRRELPGVFTILGVSERVASGSRRTRAPCSTRSSCTTACRPGWTWRSSTRRTSCRTPRSPDEQRELADDLFQPARRTRCRASSRYFEADKRERQRGGGADPTAGMTADERIHWQILHRKKEGIEAAARRAQASRAAARWRVLNDVLLPAMKDVGDKFGAGELILPFVLQSAEVMKKAVAHLEQYLEQAGRLHQGQGRAGHGLSATCTTSARTWSTRSSPTTATPSTTSASRCR